MSSQFNRSRRQVLLASGACTLTAFAGCVTDSNDDESENDDSSDSTTPYENTDPDEARELPSVAAPDEPMVYTPSHVDGMNMVGMQEVGPYMVSLSYTLVHDFWVLTGDESNHVPVEEGQVMHLMATAWDPEHNVTIPIGSPSVEIENEAGDVIVDRQFWPMISQQMGPHFGDNIGLDGEGMYDVTVTLDAVSSNQLGAYNDRFTDPESVTFEMDFTYNALNDIRFDLLNDSGEPGALQPMQMDMRPTGSAPPVEELPGEHVGVVESADAEFVVQRMREPPLGVDNPSHEELDFEYLYVLAQTPYNSYPLPFMGVEGTIYSESDTTRFNDWFESSVHPDIGYHYGAVVPEIYETHELELSVGTPPQTHRHRGYQTAFMQFEDMGISFDY